MNKCLGVREIPFASVHYDGERLDPVGGLHVIRLGGALSIKLLPEFNHWSLDSITIILVRGKRGIRSSKLSMSEVALSGAMPGDRILIMRDAYGTHWDRGYEYMEQFNVMSSEYAPGIVVRLSDMHCAL
jgi:hypothetical protein